MGRKSSSECSKFLLCAASLDYAEMTPRCETFSTAFRDFDASPTLHERDEMFSGTNSIPLLGAAEDNNIISVDDRLLSMPQ